MMTSSIAITGVALEDIKIGDNVTLHIDDRGYASFRKTVQNYVTENKQQNDNLSQGGDND